MMLNIFTYAYIPLNTIYHLNILFGEMSKSFAHFLIEFFIFLLLHLEGSLYILNIDLMSEL